MLRGWNSVQRNYVQDFRTGGSRRLQPVHQPYSDPSDGSSRSSPVRLPRCP